MGKALGSSFGSEPGTAWDRIEGQEVSLGFWILTCWEDLSVRDSAERLKTATKSLTLKPK